MYETIGWWVVHIAVGISVVVVLKRYLDGHTFMDAFSVGGQPEPD